MPAMSYSISMFKHALYVLHSLIHHKIYSIQLLTLTGLESCTVGLEYRSLYFMFFASEWYHLLLFSFFHAKSFIVYQPSNVLSYFSHIYCWYFRHTLNRSETGSYRPCAIFITNTIILIIVIIIIRIIIAMYVQRSLTRSVGEGAGVLRVRMTSTAVRNRDVEHSSLPDSHRITRRHLVVITRSMDNEAREFAFISV